MRLNKLESLCRENEEKSTRSKDVSTTPPFEGEIKGFNHSENKLEKFCNHKRDPDNHICITCHEYVPQCEHESDGVMYDYHLVNIGGISHRTKCKNCGEFYR